MINAIAILASRCTGLNTGDSPVSCMTTRSHKIHRRRLIAYNIYRTVRSDRKQPSQYRAYKNRCPLNSSKALSPPVRGHYRKYAVSGSVQKARFLHYAPIHEFSRAHTRKSYGRTHNDGVGETKVDRICVINPLDLFR